MIIIALVHIFFAVIMTVLSGVTIPTWGQEVQSAFDFVTTLLVHGTAFMAYLLTPIILLFCVGSVFVLFNFAWLYGLAKWVIEKLPFINIKL